MFLARVTGVVVATQKVASMTGRKLLTVEPLRVEPLGRDRLVGTGRTFAGAERAWPSDAWWTGYGDGQLNTLMNEGLAGSPNIAVAQARLRPPTLPSSVVSPFASVGSPHRPDNFAGFASPQAPCARPAPGGVPASVSWCGPFASPRAPRAHVPRRVEFRGPFRGAPARATCPGG